jgi:tRNA pseudouridine38-40 synthase
MNPYLYRKYFVKTRYFIYISFKGTSFHGWQIQPNSVTVQRIIEEALTMILKEEISTTGAGRTDAGVHALVFCAHFDASVPDLSETKSFVYRLNRYLPDDISVISVKKVVTGASARYSAISRTYRYYITPIKEPFYKESSWYIHGPLDIQAMNRASEMLLKHSDFTSFSRLHSNTKTNLCKIYHAGWEKKEERLVFTIKADRFLRNMVRSIVGTMVNVGSGKLSITEFEEIIAARDRCRAGMSAPAKGLFLTDIEYPREIFV